MDDSTPEVSGSTEETWWRRRRDAAAFDRAKATLRTPMTVLALVFTAGLVLDVSQELPPRASTAVTVSNVVVWAAFAAEYLWLLRLAPDRGRYVRTHLLDLVIVLLPMLRPLRALRVLRVVAVVVRAWHQVFSVLRHRGLGKIIAAVVALMIVGGVLTFALEPDTFTTVGNAVWWVLVTSTTVGYGDFAPVGAPARAMAVLVMFLGIGLVGVITASIVDFMTEEGLTRDPASPGDGTAATPPTAGTAPACAACEESAARLRTVEARLDEVLRRLGDAHVPPGPDAAPM